MKEEEKILIEKAKHGDEKAFKQLYDNYYRLIRYIIYYILKDNWKRLSFFIYLVCLKMNNISIQFAKKPMKSKVSFLYLITIFTICLSCRNDNSKKEKELQAKIKELELREKELIIKANKAEKVLIHNLPLIKDDPILEKQKIVVLKRF